MSSTVPSEWPSLPETYKYSKNAVMSNVWLIAGLVIVSEVIVVIISVAIKSRIYANIINSLLETLTTAILTPVLIASVRQKKVSLNQAFDKGIELWLRLFVLTILVNVSEGLSIIALVVPFFFVWPRLSLANYFLADKDLSIIDAYKASWNSTKDYVGAIYGIFAMELAMIILCVTIIGIPFAIYFLIMYSAVHAVLYEFINKQGVSKEK